MISGATVSRSFSLMSRSGDTVAEFRVQAGQPGLDYGGIFSFGEHPDQLERKP